MRILQVTCICICLLLSTSVAAQPSGYGAAGDNLGTWQWGTSSPRQTDADEDDDYAGTSWEQMYEDRLYEQELQKEDEAEPFSLLSAPAKIWRYFWPKRDEGFE